MKKFLIILMTFAAVASSFTACFTTIEPEDTMESTDIPVIEESDTDKEFVPSPTVAYEVVDIRHTVIPSEYTSDCRIELIAIVENTGNMNLYVGESKFDIYDEAGKLIDVIKYVEPHIDIVAPGERVVFYTESAFGGTIDINYIIKPKLDISIATNDIVRFTVTDIDVRTSSSLGYIEVIGIATNTTSVDYDVWNTSAVVYGFDNEVIAVIDTYVTELIASNDNCSFVISSFNDRLTIDKVNYVEVFAYPTQYQFN